MARTSKIARMLLAGAVLLGPVLGGAAFAEGPASASSAPVVYAARNNGWHGYTRPGTFIFGNGGAPYFTALQWKSWGSASAWGTGKLWTQKPGCSPSYKCTYVLGATPARGHRYLTGWAG